jgi:hypothetical protein
LPFWPDPGLLWLEEVAVAAEWRIDSTDATLSRRANGDGLRALLGSTPAPTALAALAERVHLQSRIRSFTGCYLDLGNKMVPVDGGGALIHILSDQQWVRRWLVLVDGTHAAPVLSSRLAIGFDGSDDDDPQQAVPVVVPVDGSRLTYAWRRTP